MRNSDQHKSTVVIGFIGSQLDGGLGPGRWEKWRPTVAIGQYPDVAVGRMELLYSPAHEAIAHRVRDDLATLSPDTHVNLYAIPFDNAWDFEEVYGKLYDWVGNYSFEPEREQYWTHITTGTHVVQICMFLMVESRQIPGVLLQTSPPKRQQGTDPGSYSLIDLDLSRYDALAQRFAAEHDSAVDFLKSGIATRNARFNALIEEIERVAVQSKAPILLIGPTGAGKSFLAKRMAELKRSRRQINGPFVEINCATLRGDGAMSSLFGHKKGSFTGAASDRAGLLKSADQGVLFLDEIGELGLDEQAMLLKAIEEKRFLPVGADREVQSDFQLIAGTNRDLRIDVVQGRFRDDLFARINLWTYDLPGLAQRPEDIEPNVEHLLALYATEQQRVVRFSAQAKAAYLSFAQSPQALWTGNFRDLSASVTRMATLAQGHRIDEGLVQAEIQRLRWLWQAQTNHAIGDDTSIDLARLLSPQQLEQLDFFDELQLQAVIKLCRQSRSLSDAGRRLFQASRAQRKAVNDADRLRKYLMKFDLTWEAIESL